jgi:sporulation protein YlmC with PRC-barrel domain
MKLKPLIALLISLGAFGLVDMASAQVAGATTTLGVSVTESTQVATGWSVKKTLMGKTIYNELGVKVGNVEDLIVTPERSVSYVIIGAGGFVGIGRHDVAIPVGQIQNVKGKLVLAGATKASIKELPSFDYADDSSKRGEFITKSEADLGKIKVDLEDLQKKTSSATAEVKMAMDSKIAAAQVDLKSAEDKLSSLKSASTKRWKEFEASVTAATARARQSLDKALG